MPPAQDHRETVLGFAKGPAGSSEAEAPMPAWPQLPGASLSTPARPAPRAQDPEVEDPTPPDSPVSPPLWHPDAPRPKPADRHAPGIAAPSPFSSSRAALAARAEAHIAAQVSPRRTDPEPASPSSQPPPLPTAPPMPPPSPLAAPPPSLPPSMASPEPKPEDALAPTTATDEKPTSTPTPAPLARELMAALAPMPAEGPPGFFSGLPYLLQVTGARFRRAGVIRAFRREIVLAEAQQTEIWRELGQHAWDTRMDHAAVREPMQKLVELDQARAMAHAATDAIDELIRTEEGRFAEKEQALKARIQTAESEVNGHQAVYNERSAELTLLRQRLSQEEKQLGHLSKERRSFESRAQKEKDTHKAALLAREASQLGPQIDKLQAKLIQSRTEVQEHEAPAAEVLALLTAARSRLDQANKELAQARADLSRAVQSAKADQRRTAEEMAKLDSETRRTLEALGRRIDEQRPPGHGLQPFLTRLAAVRDEIQENERNIQLLLTERQNYARRPYRNGWILVAIIAGVLLFGAITATVLYTLGLD